MAVPALESKMLYCPKCSSSYQEGTQRFCTNDGSRLVTSSSATKSTTTSQGVFSSLLEKKPSSYDNDEKIVPKQRVAPPQTVRTEKPPAFKTNLSSKVFNSESFTQKREEKPIQVTKPVVRLIKPNEIASGTAEVGDRALNPTGRLALTWESPKVMIGQTVKGRYYVTELIGKDDSSLTYLAEDKIIANKEVVVRILMEEKNDEFLSKIFAEERVSLSHINHPNVVKVLDSGELLEGKPFVVTERVDGFSLKEKLRKLENFNPLRTARIIRQASFALSEVHQNGILHRSLKPESVFLTVSEVGSELVKVTDFVVSNGAKKQNLENVKYLAPEQLEGKMPNFASDIYSLAVIAYQMLTGRMPFNFATADQLYRVQKAGLETLPSDVRPELSPEVDEVFVKALAYLPNERYPKARDFGDALFHALNESSDLETEPEKVENVSNKPGSILIPGLKEKKETNAITIGAKTETIEKTEDTFHISNPKNELAWEKRSPEPVNTGNFVNYLIYGLGLLILLVGTFGIVRYAMNRQPAPEYVPPKVENTVDPNQAKPTITDATQQENSPTPTEIESPPLPRSITPPPNTQYFENSKLDLKGDLAKNYRGFLLYYPNEWAKNTTDTNFIDVSHKAESGTPIEQFLVTYYESKGTFNADADKFPKLVEDSNKKLAKLIANYRFISEGEKTINNGWRAYEMKFQGEGETQKGEKITMWGRRLFIPAARPGVKSGFVITMVATSLSPVVKSADDVGIKGDLGSILETFEPSTKD
ncbi:MAG TPA: serine/threonine-protein kinase [Pyrinomonadaceae bacterium]|nr:serine/threonine-protein kinase [Pyrinomonadaceae bacterium]